jgi:hypothetical protein
MTYDTVAISATIKIAQERSENHKIHKFSASGERQENSKKCRRPPCAASFATILNVRGGAS